MLQKYRMSVTNYFASDRGAKYCDQIVDMSVCLSDRISQKTTDFKQKPVDDVEPVFCFNLVNFLCGLLLDSYARMVHSKHTNGQKPSKTCDLNFCSKLMTIYSARRTQFLHQV